MSNAPKEIPAPSEAGKTRFWSKVAITQPNECWEWQDKKDKDGYGRITLQYINYKAHRLAYVIQNGPFPAEKPFAVHSCDNPGCVNPAHIRAGTIAENNADMIAKNRQRSITGDDHYSRTNPERVSRGENSGKGRLTNQIVLEIRAMRNAGMVQQSIADQFHISQSLVSLIVRKKLWAHLP